MSEGNFFEEFEFDLPAKLLEELVKLFSEMPEGPLDAHSIRAVEEQQGVYQLFNGGQLVYIGKTDSDAGLKNRLIRHARKIQGRQHLDACAVTFKAIRVFVFTAMDLESLLINHYKDKGLTIPWQNSGFGSNDPGRRRDTSEIKDGHFDALYPIDLDFVVDGFKYGEARAVADVLRWLKSNSPYLIRFETQGRSRVPHPDLTATEVLVQQDVTTVREFLYVIKKALGAAWQITALPGYVIIYKENSPGKYSSGLIIE